MLASRRVVFGGTDATGALRVAPGWIAMEAGTIAETGEGAPPTGARDYGERLLAPAFVNAHTHCALHALRGALAAETEGNVVEDLFYRVESRMEAGDVTAFARMGAYESLLSGVGLVWDHYFHGVALAEAFADVGLCAVVAPTLQDRAGPAANQWAAQLEATEAIARDARWAERGVFAALGPHATDTVSAALWGRVAEASERLNLPVHAHLAQSVEEVERAQARHGRTPLRWLRDLGLLERCKGVFAHALYLDREELRMLPGHTLVSCPYSQLEFAFPARVDVWEQEGIRWALATDCAATNDSMGLRKEMRFVAGQRSAGTLWDATYEAFLDGDADARAVWARRQRLHARLDARPEALLGRVWATPGTLHPALRAGVLAPGALANVLVYDLQHPSFWPGRDPLRGLVMGDVDGALDALWIRGEQLGADGDVAALLRTERYRAHREEADARLARLLEGT